MEKPGKESAPQCKANNGISLILIPRGKQLNCKSASCPSDRHESKDGEKGQAAPADSSGKGGLLVGLLQQLP